MIPSLNEVTSTARKAAKGVGYTWGHADDAGRATAWLWGHGIDGITALSQLLKNTEPSTCPIRIGTRFCDAPPSTAITFPEVQSPILLLSFAAELAKIIEADVALTIGEIPYSASVKGMFGQTEGHPVRAKVTLALAPATGPHLALVSRRTAPTAAWEALNVFAHKTYAPATEASRLAGAGAGVTDND